MQPSNGAQGVLWGTNQSFHIIVANPGSAAARDVVLDIQVSGGIIRSATGVRNGGTTHPQTAVTSTTKIRQTHSLLEVGNTIGVVVVVLAAGPGPVDLHGWVNATNDVTGDQGGFIAPLYFAEDGVSPLAINAEDSAYDRKRGIIYLYEKYAGTIWPVSSAQPRILDPIQTGQRGHIALSADGGSLYVGMHFTGVTRIDTRTWEQTEVYRTNFIGTSWDIKVSPADPTLVAVSHGDGTQLIWGGEALPESTASFGPIAFTEDGTKLFLNDVNRGVLQSYHVTTNGLVLEAGDKGLSLSDFDLWGTKLYSHSGIIYDMVTGDIDQTLAGNAWSYAGQAIINRLVDTNGTRRIQRLDRLTLREIELTGYVPFISPSILREASDYDLVAYSPGLSFNGGNTFWVNLAPKSPRVRVLRRPDGMMIARISHFQPNQQFRLERTERLDSPSWQTVWSGALGGDAILMQGLATPPPRAFFRAVTEP